MKSENEPRAVVWDLDGVIVDSGPAHNVSWTRMAADFGVPYDPDTDFKPLFGRHNTDIIQAQWGVQAPEAIQRMADRKEVVFRELAGDLQPLPGVRALMQALKDAGWRQGIGSSAPIENVQLLLSGTGLGHFMDALTTAEDVTVGKPDPRVFRIAFERLGVDPRNGVVIEDATAGVQAALAAGASVVAITNTQPEDVLKQAGANLVLGSLEELKVSDLEGLVAARAGSRDD